MTIPLVVMSPKSLLRHASVVSPIADFTDGTFLPIISDPKNPQEVSRLILCSGKVYFDLLQMMDSSDQSYDHVSVCRIEKFYPFPESLLEDELKKFDSLEKVVWLQEEPENMGAWTFLRYRLDELLERIGFSERIQYAGRVASAATATGSAIVHQAEQNAVLEAALNN